MIANALSKVSLFHKSILFIVVLLSCEVFFLSILGSMLQKAEQELWQESRAKTIIGETNIISTQFFQAIGALAAFKATKDPLYAQRCDSTINQIEDEMEYLDLIARQYPEQKSNIANLHKLVSKNTALFKKVRQRLDGTDRGLKILSVREMQQDLEGELEHAIIQLNKFAAVSRKQVSSLDPSMRYRTKTRVMILQGVAFNVILAVVLCVIFTRGITRRLEVVVDNTRLLTEKKQLHEPLGQDDEIGQLDRSFHSMADSLRKMEQMRRDFTAMIGHDLRSPLAAIYTSLALILDDGYGELPPTLRSRLKSTESTCKRLLRLLTDLVEIEKIESAKLELIICQFVLSDVVNRVLENLSSLAEVKNVSFAYEATDSTIVADPDRLEQVLENLVSNAIKFSPRKGVITIETIETEEFHVLSVADRGRGIKPEDQLRIFNRFEQSQLADSRISAGTGLGLAITKNIIELHGGSIEVISKEGEGSTFRFKIPRAKSSELDAQVQSPPTGAAADR